MGGPDTPLDHARWSHERSYWLREALANDPGAPCPPLSGETEADVLIVGGGYTGMWTAHFLKEREPALDVVVLEQDICGGGPSGRNGGFVNDLAEEVETLLEVSGAGGARAVCEASGHSVRELGSWCEKHGVNAWYEPRPHPRTWAWRPRRRRTGTGGRGWTRWSGSGSRPAGCAS
ncbi:MAG: FAD-dependent oxidoreductase [Actinobacteria bacterium]|nr:MAG: FAD-dependent oxidoreductase [Actinomycetota bacterium]